MSKELQSIIFAEVAKNLKDRFPHKSLSLVHPDQLVFEDLQFLTENKKLIWAPSLKVLPGWDFDSGHPIRVVIYYRAEPIGYAFGGYNEALSSVEIHWMEKRNDAHEDLKHQMLGIALDTYSAYAKFLRSQGLPVTQIALVGPVEGVRRYYQESNFTYVGSYNGSQCAMILTSSKVLIG